MSKATNPSIPQNLTVQEAAAAIVRLINEKPQTPRQDEIATVIARVVATPATLPQLSPEHLEYRRLVAEVEGMPGGSEAEEEELRLASDRVTALERQIWATPAKTLADVLLRGEIAPYNENDILATLDDPDAFYDERSVAQLIKAVVDVLCLYSRGHPMKPLS